MKNLVVIDAPLLVSLEIVLLHRQGAWQEHCSEHTLILSFKNRSRKDAFKSTFRSISQTHFLTCLTALASRGSFFDRGDTPSSAAGRLQEDFGKQCEELYRELGR
jgi:hypothetical protein